MNLQLVYRYILSLSKNENLFYEKKNKTKQKDKKSVPRRESNPGLPTYKRDAVSVAPRQLILNIRAYDKLIIFNAFADEILPVDTV